MSDYETINTFLVDVWGRINKIEERSLSASLGADISITEINIVEKIGDHQPRRMSEVSKALGVTLATLTVACDRLEAKGLVERARDHKDKRVVNVRLTAKGRAVYEYHKQFHERMIDAALSDLTPQEQSILADSLLKLQKFFLSESE